MMSKLEAKLAAAYNNMAYWQDMYFKQPSKYRQAKMIAAEQEHLHLMRLYIVHCEPT